MSDATVGQLIVAGTAVLSGGLGLLGGILIEHLRTRRDRAARTESRQDQKDDFQRQTLLDLQEAVARFGRAVGRAHHQDIMAHRESGKWGRSLLGDDLDQEYVASQVHLQLLRERARDDELRRLATRFQNLGVLVTMSQSKDQATSRMDDWIECLGNLQDRLGMVLRGFV
ncbi:MAG TPA: hypothetical protein VK256_01055 [Candidatus Eisenbacteria bacterium]|nr:hypothetical protein [Candidatus Eisenbacteria bacterium]